MYLKYLCIHLTNPVAGVPVLCLGFQNGGKVSCYCYHEHLRLPEVKREKNPEYQYPYIYRGVELDDHRNQFCKIVKRSRNKVSTLEFEDGKRYNVKGCPVKLRE